MSPCGRQAQTGQQQLAMIRVLEHRGSRRDYGGDAFQAQEYRSGLVEPPHVGVGRCEILTDLVGRAAESDLSRERLREAWACAGQIVLLSVEAGIGKSRLAAQLGAEVANEPHTPLRYHISRALGLDPSTFSERSRGQPRCPELQRRPRWVKCEFASRNIGSHLIDPPGVGVLLHDLRSLTS